MIENLRLGSVDSNKYTPLKQKGNKDIKNPSFTGLGNLAMGLVQKCEQQPMVNVSVLDLSTAIIPRSFVETYAGSKRTDENGNPAKRELNVYAGMEAFRRESSGLIVNCLIPSFIVMGAAWLLQLPVMKGFGKANLSNVWANEESLKIVQKYLINAKGKGSVRLENALNAFMQDLSGVDGKILDKKFIQDGSNNAVISKGVKQIAKSSRLKKHSSVLFNRGYNTIVKASHMSEHLRLNGHDGYLSKDLKGYLKDFVDLHKAFEKEGINTAEKSSKYISKAVKLVNVKSLAGLGIIIPLAISMQPINRWITRKTSGKKGAPIYTDFKDRKEDKILTPKEKQELLKQKFISIASMVGVAALSMFMDRPSLKNILQFKGLFPTMDQARIISTATFASRMAVSEDKNELREATVRDIATFASLYFLGDYVSKGIATLIEYIYNKGKDGTKKVHLINRLKEPSKDANVLRKFWNWAKHTAIKSSDELVTVRDKNLRTVCQIGNIAFSLIALGVFIPLYNRAVTNKKHAEELAKLKAEKADANAETTINSDNAAQKHDTPSTYKFSESIIKDNTAFKSFITS